MVKYHVKSQIPVTTLTDRRGGPAGPKPGAWHKTGLVGDRELQSYAPHGTERTKCEVSALQPQSEFIPVSVP